jgi:protein phosphatase
VDVAADDGWQDGEGCQGPIVEVGLAVDAGRRRRRNEDRVLSCAIGPGAHLLAVADGMGGVPGGDLASDAVMNTLRRLCGPGLALDPPQGLARIFAEANAAVRAASRGDRSRRGMGSTLVAAVLAPGGLWLGNVGDSRAYVARSGVLTQHTTDHSWVAELVRAGQMHEAEAAASPRRNIITRSLGGRDRVEADIAGPLPFGRQDVLLLCSDGLYTMVPEKEMAAIVSALPPRKAADRLVDAANYAGGHDNIGVVVARPARSRTALSP